MADTQLEKIKRRLGITNLDQDDLLTDLIDDAESHFKLLTGVNEIPDKFKFMIRDVAIKRYNRKGSEGMSSETVDGYAVNYDNGVSDFSEYLDFLENEFKKKKTRRSSARFVL